MTDERAKQKIWTKAETLLFLSCYKDREEEFDDPLNTKTAYAHILEDMLDQGFEDQSVTVTSLETKMKSLLSAHKDAKDNDSRTVHPYMDELDELFGNKAIVSPAHTLNVGIRRNAVPLPQQNISDEKELLAQKSCEPSTSAVTSPIVSRSSEPSISAMKKISRPFKKKSRKTAKERYYEAKLNMTTKYLARKLQLRREKEEKLIELIITILNK